ncbi:uncharacterized protein CCOS01_01991 [Colletotrichum costaricense]|uniref:Uncharacterized protein n=2 Tax=Colletotrichum acutatum species complex TaxID=2707335 RepID=A0AAI9Z6Y5_9PEZI|nr:uncharacterized protein CCOS01_01991 [Colletotrichum costaricense]XP_060383864.1 uncharacterized protein CTAM01_05620 [Colletotrichum tamarilloi]KAK1502182.1 hypothetical protein CTAM01_05620 [Colletotrichum tamarilloi]KAK1536671.1 hypothetical protein CCOS01_01991 [Colletotrichum costaricense]
MWSQSDYTSFAREPGDQVLAQLIMEPLGTIIVACIGIICTSLRSVGGFLTVVFVFVMQPLSLLNSAGNFLTVVGSFNVFLGPLKGIMFADDFLIRKRTMELTGL